ncbi:hypothetical protein HMPREF1564_3832 [Providencia alcalifaciens R90-1475]|nr:hypothetical protein HMPREF1564_3832 [Providencia alcalifaciens R90-1475]
MTETRAQLFRIPPANQETRYADGSIYQPVNRFKTKQRKLAVVQLKLSRKVKFRANRKKLKQKIQRLHLKSPLKSAKTTP